MDWLLLYMVLTSDVNRNWIVSERQQEMPSQIVCERTAAKLPALSTVRRQFMNIRCEPKPVAPTTPS